VLLAFLGIAVVGQRMADPDRSWDRHDGTSVSANGTPVIDLTELNKGDRVLVEQSGTWWRGRALAVNPDGSVRIHYVGWGSDSDETVPRSRLQLP
jgi:hypothetical protein